MNRVIPYARQSIDEDDIQAIVNVLQSDWLTTGPQVEAFENALCEKLGSKYGTVVANGTAALHLSGLAMGWKKGDIVITTPITFLSSANCILYANATPDFVDIDKVSYTIDVNKLESKIKNYFKKGQKVKAVIGVDYAGHPCSWKEIRFLADKYEFQILDDACHAIGSKYKNEISYASKYADAATLSFHPVKHITSGEGGAVLTNDKVLDEKVKTLRTHGVKKNENSLGKNIGPWYYEMHYLGFNYRITDLQCALGISQLKKLDHFIEKRQKIARYYDEAFSKDESFIIPTVSDQVSHAYHLYPLQINFDRYAVAKKTFFLDLRARNIFCQVHYIPVHLQPYYQKKFGFKIGDFPVAENFYIQETSIPIYPALAEEDLHYITSAVFQTLGH